MRRGRLPNVLTITALGLWRCSQAWEKSEARASHPQVDEGQCEYKSNKRPPGRGPRKFELKTACIEAGERRNNDPDGPPKERVLADGRARLGAPSPQYAQ